MARVLIVDDTEIVRRALELAVKKMGHEAESTSDALAALELARLRQPDLVLLDFRMPVMDGVTLFRQMRSALGERCPKVLFVSATPPDELRAKTAPDVRPIGYVKKPFHLDDLSRVVNEALAA
jgi:two-component system, OmpR family, response regulator